MSSRSSRSYGWSQGFWLVDSTHVTHTHAMSEDDQANLLQALKEALQVSSGGQQV